MTNYRNNQSELVTTISYNSRITFGWCATWQLLKPRTKCHCTD